MEMSEKAKEHYNNIDRFINGGMHSAEEVVNQLANNHRTLQQNMTRFCLMFLEKMAEKEPNQTDLRNEQSVEVSKKLIAGFRRKMYEEELLRTNDMEKAISYSESEFVLPSRWLGHI